ncbi:MAG: hypothetical protein ACQESN_11470 [Thermotogota bacterium]
MKKAFKLYNKWCAKNPREANRNDVELLIKEFFGNNWRHHKSSHIVAWSELLKGEDVSNPEGEISIPVKKNIVKGIYVKFLIKAVNIIVEKEEVK